MDWQQTRDRLTVWFSLLSGIPRNDVAWAGAAVGMRNSITADLSLTAHTGVLGDEVLLGENEDDPDGNLEAEVRGNRQRTLSCRVRSRDQRPEGKALVFCERVRDRIDLPSSQAFFEELGIGLQSVGGVFDLSRPWDNRIESEAVLDLIFNFAVSEVEADSGVGTIEHVEVGGTVHEADATVITVPDTTIPPLS